MSHNSKLVKCLCLRVQAFLICVAKVFGDTSECADTGLFAPFLFVCRKTKWAMSNFRKWELSYFCGIYGRVIPHYLPDGKHFVSFHCSNRDGDTPTIKVDDSLGEMRFVDLFGYNKSIVQIGDEYVLFSNERADALEQEHRETETSHNTITRAMQDTSYKAYEKCTNYDIKMESLFFSPMMLQSRYSLICKDDCLYPTCPFYSKWAIDNRAYQHKNDYDEWIVEAYKQLK